MTPVHPLLDAHLRRSISRRSPAVSSLQTSGNSLSHRSELISPAAAPLTTVRTEIVTRRASIPPNNCLWTSMLQLQAIRLAAEPAIEVIPNGATKKDLLLAGSTITLFYVGLRTGLYVLVSKRAIPLRGSMQAQGECGLRSIQVRLTAGYPSILIANQ